MSAPTTAPTRSRTRLPDDDDALIFHRFHRVDLDLAEQAGIQARSICGVWISPDVRGSSGKGMPGRSRICKRCERSMARLLRERFGR